MGFSGSGKTVYLTMLYYATGVTNSFHEGWEADFLALDDGLTEGYLKTAYKGVLGIGPDGKLVFEDPMGTRVKREFPKGTDEQSMLQFALTRSTGIRDHILKVKTLDVKGEALRHFAANPTIPTKEELDRSPQLKMDLQRWRQLRDLCEQAGAILLFFNLLNWEGYDHIADINTLVGLLLNQRKPPRALIFVVTGTDVLNDENEIEGRRQKIIKEFEVAIRRLESRKVAWDVIMISNFGHGFTRKIEKLPAGHPCVGKAAGHICNRCQELVPNIDARPQPENLAAPWEFIYEHLHRQALPVELFLEGTRLARVYLFSRVALLAVLLLAIILPGVRFLGGLQAHREVAGMIAKGLTISTLPGALTLERDTNANRIYRFFYSPPDPGSDDPEGQLIRLGQAEVVYDDTSKPTSERLAAAQAALTALKPPFVGFVPIRELQLEDELSSISSESANPLDRLAAANKALRAHNGSQGLTGTAEDNAAANDKVHASVNQFLDQLSKDITGRYEKLKIVMSSLTPLITNEAPYLDYLQNLQSAIERDEISRIPATEPIRSELVPIIEDYSNYVEYAKLTAKEELTVEQLNSKADAVAIFLRNHPTSPLIGAAGALEVDLQTRAKDQLAESASKELPIYDSAAFDGKQRNFTRFVEIMKQYSVFLDKNKVGTRSDEKRKDFQQMQRDATLMLEGLANFSARDLADMDRQDVTHTVAEWEADVSRTQADIQALKDLSAIVEIASAKDVQAGLEKVLLWEKAGYDFAQLLAAAPKDDKQMADQASAIDGLVQKYPADVPARRQAVLAKSRLEDTLFANQMDAALTGLASPSLATLQASQSAFDTTLKAYDGYIKDWTERIGTDERRKRFEAYLAESKRIDPLKVARDNRDHFATKLAEKSLWTHIDELQKQRDPAHKEELRTAIDKYLANYPDGEKAADAKALSQFVDSWQLESVRFKVELLGYTESGTARLSIEVSPAGGGDPIVTKVFTVNNGRLEAAAAAADGGLQFKWNNAQDVKVNVVLTGSGGREIYNESRTVQADSFDDQITRLFTPHKGMSVKLTSIQ